MGQTFDRRSILKSIVVIGAAGVLEGCSSDDAKERIGSPSDSARRFPQSLASGDPRQTSVILWTRAVDPDATGDVRLRLEVALDTDFTRLVVQQDGLLATAEHDGCIKVRLKGLTPATTYYYRFSQLSRGTRYRTRTGRTRTAADPAADVPVRFAVANCQDYVGRYWNSYQQMLTKAPEDLDFVVAIGDYVYETTASPGFQTPGNARTVAFSEPSSALDLGGGNLAARSVSNYRDLYRTYRSDALLQQVHERWPFVVTWDDHEYSDDCHGSVATYTNGRKDEKDDERRRNAEQAFFEWIPVDEGATGPDPKTDVLVTDRSQLYPNQKLWRSFTFGKHLELVMTDLRSFRADHPIPEDAFPGTVVADQATLLAAIFGGSQAAFDAAFPVGVAEYVDVDGIPTLKAGLVQIVTGAAVQQGLSATDAAAYAARVVQGKLALLVVNSLLAAAGQPAVPATGLERGLSYALMGKQTFFDSLGARYVVVKPAYDVYTALLYARTQGASEDAFGAEQQAFVVQRLTRSTATHKVLVSSYSLISMQLDLRSLAAAPAQFRQSFYFDVDQWDGFPNRRAALYQQLAGVQNLVFLSGDIHAAFAGNETAASPKFALLTSPAISSQALGEELGDAVASFPNGGPTFQPGGAVYEALVNGLPQLLTASTGGAIKLVDTAAHGFLTLECTAPRARATFTLIPSTEVSVDYSKQPPGALAAKVTTRAFDVAAGQLTPVPA